MKSQIRGRNYIIQYDGEKYYSKVNKRKLDRSLRRVIDALKVLNSELAYRNDVSDLIMEEIFCDYAYDDFSYRQGFHVTGHNYEYKDDGKSAFYDLVKREDIENKLRKYYEENGLHLLTIQGELCAPGIQQNRLKLARPEWYVFTIRIDGKRVGLKKMQEICEALNLQMVPIEEVGTDLPSKYPTVEALLERADGEYAKGGKKEGIVIRPTEPIFSERISASLSMKVVSNKYLLKNEDK